MADTLALHTHRGTPAVQRMVEFAPSSGGLALWAHHQDLPDAARAGEPSARLKRPLCFGHSMIPPLTRPSARWVFPCVQMPSVAKNPPELR